MDNKRKNFKGIALYLIVSFLALIVLLIVEQVYIKNFNNTERCVEGEQYGSLVSVLIKAREDRTSAWIKRDFELDGVTVDLTAQIFDATFFNNSKYDVEKWQIRINVNDLCFINQAWCGKIEIHQNVSTDEKVQTLDLSKYNLEDITLDLIYKGELLIPLYEGDYIIYHPSEKDRELMVEKGAQITMGFILYYIDTPNLSDYKLTYNYNRSFKDGRLVLIIVILALSWAICLIGFTVYYITYKSAVKEMEIKKSGILSMSDMYSVIYIVDTVKKELIPLVEDAEFEANRQRNLSAIEQLDKMFEDDCETSYRTLAGELCDVQKIKERLVSGNTFAFEYISRTRGWRRIRLFPMKEKDSAVLEKIVFTIQDINDEKAWIEEIEKKAEEAEHESNAKSTFLANMSHEIRTPINTVIGFDTMILREAKDPAIKSYAKSINSAANMLLSLINGILDVSKLEADKMELVMGEYSFKQMIIEVVNMVKARAEFEKLEFICDISPNIAGVLYGDAVRLKQVIINLITNAAKYTDKGNVKLSIFGKEHDDMMHLLVSVKDTGIGIKEEDLEKVAKRFQRFESKRNHTVEGTGIGLNLVTGILDLMGSELHVISKYGEGSEFYFELEQRIVDSAAIGEFNFTEEVGEDEEYSALFTAPDAHVLVVDDNVMNLKVFTDLLKETELKIDTASSGAEALVKTEADKYDLIFMDHMMPEMDGIETFTRIRGNKNSPNIKTPVVILTANALKGAKEEYKKAGFDDFLAKPIQPELLEQMVIKHLDPAKVNKNEGGKKKETQVSLPTIAGVDVPYGLAHTGGIANYMSLLNQFAAVSESDMAELLSYAELIKKDKGNTEAMASFRIKVHAMKSSSNVLGALKVYGVAATLEELAAKEDVKGVCAIFPYFESEWRNLTESVTESLPKQEEKKEIIDKKTVDNLLHLLETSIKAYDIKAADEFLGKLKEFKWENPKADMIKQLETAVANLDAEKVVDICEELKK